MTGDYQRILEGLERAVETRPELADMIRLYTDLLMRQAQVYLSLRLPPFEFSEIVARQTRGEPLLDPEAVRVDADTLRELCFQIGLTTAQHRRELSQPLARIHAWLHERQASLPALAREYVRDGRIQSGEAAGLDGDLLAFVFNHSLRPFLRAYATALVPYLNGYSWERGSCPVCGGQPDFAVLEKENGARLLLCSRCDAEWRFRRVGCPFCEDEARSDYYAGDNPAYRLYICDPCRHYLKTLDAREVADERPLPVERILTIGMDVAARQAGYLGV